MGTVRSQSSTRTWEKPRLETPLRPFQRTLACCLGLRRGGRGTRLDTLGRPSAALRLLRLLAAEPQAQARPRRRPAGPPPTRARRAPRPSARASPSVHAPSDVAAAIHEGVGERLRLVLVLAAHHREQRLARRPGDGALDRAEASRRTRSAPRTTTAIASPTKPSDTTTGSSARATDTPKRFMRWPVDDELQHQRRHLRDQVDLREDGGAHVGVVAERGHHLRGA